MRIHILTVLFWCLCVCAEIVQAVENPVEANEKALIPSADSTGSFLGLGLGVGLSLTVVSNGDAEVIEAEADINGIVRLKQTVSRQPRIVLESHYFFGLPAGNKLPFLLGWLGKLGCGTTNICGQGPFVAIEPGGKEDTIEAFALGYMVGFKRRSDPTDNSSWNFGIGYVADPSVRYLGHGLTANAALPEGDSVRFREESRAGLMVLTSFTF